MQDAKRTEEEATQQDNKIINVSCILFTKGKSPEQVQKMRTVRGQRVGGLAVLSQSV